MKSKVVKNIVIAAASTVIQSAWSEAGVMQIVNIPLAYQQGELHEAPEASMMCELYSGAEEFTENWYINGLELSISDPDYPEEPWYGAYDPAEQKFTFSEYLVEDESEGDVIVTSSWTYTWEVVWSEVTQEYVGSIVENKVLSWNLDSRTSTCSTLWEMRATGVPAFADNILPLNGVYQGSRISEGANAL